MSRPGDGKQAQEREFSVEEALQFLDKIRITYADKPKVYGEFLEMMKNYKAGTIQTSEMTIQIQALFGDQQDLISNFHKFMPDEAKENDGENITEADTNYTVNEQHSTVSAQVAPTKDEAWNYSKKVHDRFSAESCVYSSFVAVLSAYRIHENHAEVLEQVLQLFAGHSDLLTEFVCFLPNTAQDKAKARVQEAVREAELRLEQSKSEPAHAPTLTPAATLPTAAVNTIAPESSVVTPPTDSIPCRPNGFAPTVLDQLSQQHPTSCAVPAVPAVSTVSTVLTALTSPTARTAHTDSLVATVSPVAAPGSKVRGNGSGRKRTNSTSNTSARASHVKKTIVTRGSTSANDEYFSPVPEVPAEKAVVRTKQAAPPVKPEDQHEQAPVQPMARGRGRPPKRKPTTEPDTGTGTSTFTSKAPDTYIGTQLHAAAMPPARSTHNRDVDRRLSQLEATVAAQAREIAQLKTYILRGGRSF